MYSLYTTHLTHCAVYLYMYLRYDCIGQDGTIFLYSLLKLNKSEDKDKERERDRDREEDGDHSPLSSSVSSVT